MQQADLLQNRFDVSGQTGNIAFQLVLQYFCKTLCTFLSSVFLITVALKWSARKNQYFHPYKYY